MKYIVIEGYMNGAWHIVDTDTQEIVSTYQFNRYYAFEECNKLNKRWERKKAGKDDKQDK